MSTKQRFRCSGWAQQGSNLRPLGEQRTVYQGDSNPTDHAEHRSPVYPVGPLSTGLTAEKVTADLGHRPPRRRPFRSRLADALGVAALFPFFYVGAVLLDRQDRRDGAR